VQTDIFCNGQNTVISSTYFPHKEMHKRTQASPNGIVINHIDHILIERQFASSMLDVRSYHGASRDSDHYMVNISFRLDTIGF
jgi:endonuclease/exonuclease/phosphatase family metal-dependent hydrolase